MKVTIDGTDRTTLIDALAITSQLNERDRAVVVISDVLPARHEEIVSFHKDNTTPMFGGLILMRSFAGRTQVDPDYQVTLECGDYFAFADWAYATVTYPADVSLAAVLGDLVTGYLGAYGITLDPAQPTGPTLTAFSWATKRISDAIRELSDRTGYVARISPSKVLLMFLPGTVAAPFSITEAATNAIEVAWRDSDREVANSVTIIGGPTGNAEINDERHYGDGVTRAWVLDAPYVGVIGALHVFSEGAGGYPVGEFGVDDLPWTVEIATSTVHQRADQPVIAAGDYWWMSYLAQFPFTVTAATGATPVISHVEARPDVLSRPAALEIAEGILAQLTAAPREVTITTDRDGLEIGHAIVVDLPTTRSITGTFVITAVSMTIELDPSDGGDPYWVYRAEAIDSFVYQGSYLDQWRRMTGSVGGGSTVGGGVTTPPGEGGGGPASPIYLGGSRQFSQEPSPAAWLPVVDHVPFVAAAAFAGLVRAEVWARHAGVSVSTRLYNVTDAAVTALGPVITATTPTPITFAAAIAAGKAYRLEVLASAAAEGTFAIGSLEVA